MIKIMKRLLLIQAVFLIMAPYAPQAMAQTEALDSLNRILNLTEDDNQKIKNLVLIANELRPIDKQKSWDVAERALVLAGKTGDNQGIASSLTTKGLLCEDADDYLRALNFYTEALDIYKNTENRPDIARLHSLLGSVYKTMGNYEKGIENCLEALKIYEKLGDQSGIAQIFRIMGSIYKYKGDYEKSLFYYFSGLKINEEIGNLSGVANSYNNIGVTYIMMNEPGKALSYYYKSLDINKSMNYDSEAAINYGNIGVAYRQLGQMDSAIFYLEKRYNIAVKLNDRKGMAISLEAYGDYHFAKKDYVRAIDFYERTTALSRELGILETTKNALKSLSDLYYEKNEYDKAFSYLKSYIDLRDSLLNKESLQRIQQMEMEYSIEKEQNEHLLAEQKNRLFITIGFIALIFFILILVVIYMVQNIKLRQKKLNERTLEMEKTKLQYDLRFKNKELFSKAVYLAEKNEMINELTSRLGSVLTDPGSGSVMIKEIIKNLKYHSNTQVWDEFESTFLKVHPEFFKSLAEHFPSLTNNDRKLCAFIRLNLSTKDISNITHQSLHSITVARTRLRKKLGLSNTGENLSGFLSKV